MQETDNATDLAFGALGGSVAEASRVCVSLECALGSLFVSF